MEHVNGFFNIRFSTHGLLRVEAYSGSKEGQEQESQRSSNTRSRPPKERSLSQGSFILSHSSSMAGALKFKEPLWVYLGHFFISYLNDFLGLWQALSRPSRADVGVWGSQKKDGAGALKSARLY